MSEITELSYSKTSLFATVGSTLEVFLQHPLVVIKNSIQCNRQVTFNPTKVLNSSVMFEIKTNSSW